MRRLGQVCWNALTVHERFVCTDSKVGENERNQKMYKGLVSSSTKETLFRVLSFQSSSLFISLVIVVVYGVGSHQVLGETLTIGMLVASVTYLQNALNPVQAINNFYAELQGSEVALNRIETFLQTPPEELAARNEETLSEDEDDHIHAQQFDSAASVNEESQAAVDVECLQVSYDGVHILKDVDLTVERNQTAAFVGRSGSGKTTLFRTLAGFMGITSGDVKIGDRSLHEMNRHELNAKIGIVFQESYIFKGTIAENIKLGNLQASDEEIVEAAYKANLQSCWSSCRKGFIRSLTIKAFNCREDSASGLRLPEHF